MCYLSTRIPACAPTGSTSKEEQQKKRGEPPQMRTRHEFKAALNATDLSQIEKILSACHAPALFAASAAC